VEDGSDVYGRLESVASIDCFPFDRGCAENGTGRRSVDATSFWCLTHAPHKSNSYTMAYVYEEEQKPSSMPSDCFLSLDV
jgi:hypothetical protein